MARTALRVRFLGREGSDHGLSLGCFWGRGRQRPSVWKGQRLCGPRYCDTIAAMPHIARHPFREVSSANKGLPLPLGRGVRETKSKNGRSRPRKPFISRVFCAQRGIETVVSDHGLGRGQTMG